MRFPTIRYLTWAKRRFDEAPPKFNLAASGMQPPSLVELGIDPARLGLAGQNVAGLPALRARVGARYGVGPERVLLAAGTSLANFVALAAVVEEGDRAVCEWPAYEPLWRALEAVGARVEFVTRPEPEYAVDVDALVEKFAQGVKVVVLSDLHNPSGVLAGRDELRALAQAAERYGAWLLVDEVYLSGVFPAVESAASFGSRVIVTGSLTKTWGLGSLRAGWAVAPAAVVDRGHEVMDHLGVNAPYVAEAAALAAFERLEALTVRSRERRAAHWPMIHEFARDHMLELSPAAGGFIAWMRLPGALQADPFVDRLFVEHETLVVPGTFFGAPHHIRLGFGGPTAEVREGLARLAAAIAAAR
jgi:hypothetical protein